MGTELKAEHLKIISYNMHGFMQGYPVLEDFMNDDNKPDLFLVQEHWLTPANLSRLDKYFPDYFSFGCSAMTKCVESGMLRGRPFGGVMTLINKRLRKFVETIHCEERYTAVRVANCLIVNVYLPCAGSSDRLFVCEELLASISALRERYHKYQCVIAGDFNVNLDSSDPVARCINKFLDDCSLIRCDDVFPLRKAATYVNEALRHESCIDYVLVSDPHQVIDYGVVSPDINFSDHLPLAVVMKGVVYDSRPIDKQKCDSKSIQLQLRWDKGDLISFYQFTGYFLTPLLAEVEKMLLLCSDCSHLESCKTDLTVFVNRVFGDIVKVLSNGANAYVPTYRKNFFQILVERRTNCFKRILNRIK